MSYEKPGDITQTWEIRCGFLWMRKKKIEVHAWQEEIPPPYMPGASLAMVEITINGMLAHSAEISWTMPNGNLMLSMQVWLLSQQPNYPCSQYQPIMERFAHQCEGFEKPTHVWWNTDHSFDLGGVLS